VNICIKLTPKDSGCVLVDQDWNFGSTCNGQCTAAWLRNRLLIEGRLCALAYIPPAGVVLQGWLLEADQGEIVVIGKIVLATPAAAEAHAAVAAELPKRHRRRVLDTA